MRYFIMTLALVLLPFQAQALDGINHLITVTQEKSDNANSDALDGADKQRDLIQEQKQQRERQRGLEEITTGSPRDPAVHDQFHLENSNADGNRGTASGLNLTPPSSGTGLGAKKASKPPKALKLPNPNEAKLKQLDAEIKALKEKMDSLSGLGEEQQAKINQMQDLMAKMAAVMSSVMKKMSDTQSGVVQNMK